MIPGSNWIGEYTRFSFDELKEYVAVLKEIQVPGTVQRVPLLDSELNENQEILLTFLRRFIQAAYGDGTENNGFKIVALPAGQNQNDFLIRGGNGTGEGAGSIFVAGWRVIIPSDKKYSAQIPTPVPLTTPLAPRVDEVYVDVYYDEIGPGDDGLIIDPTIGFETSRRLAIKWAVKVAEGGATPAAYTDATGLPHWTYKLATLNRLAGNATITDAMAVDSRGLGLAKVRKEFLHRQVVAAEIWTVPHNLGCNYAYVKVFDDTGEQIEPGKVTPVSANQLTIDFDGVTVAGTVLVKGVRE